MPTQNTDKSLSSTKKGDSFRDKVANLIRSCKNVEVSTEKRIAGKKADVFYEEVVPYRKAPFKIAIECKYFSQSLKANQLRRIMSEYRPAYEKKELHVLYIIQRAPTADGYETLEAEEWVQWRSYDRLFFELIDFSTYINELKYIDSNNGVKHYHIKPKDNNGNSIESIIDKWIYDDTDFNPIAILAEYGMGKTSLAHRVARKYANLFFEKEGERIPIFIKLGDIVEASSIKALISKQFNATYEVSNFSYSKFQELNRRGHFIIIYDGFDEMKHAMSEYDFNKMFSELNQLVEGKSKVILLGRPNAFLSDDEKNKVLRGSSNLGSIQLTDHNSPCYREISLSYFVKEDIQDFAAKYIEYIKTKSLNLADYAKDESFARNRIKEVSSEHLYSLAKRPVHAKMLVDLAMSTDYPIDSITRFQLYRHFTDKFFDRELEKNARTLVTFEERLKFIKYVAVDLWKRNLHSFESSEYSDTLLRQFLDNENDLRKNSSLMREFVVGSMLVTEKCHGTYYFSHRSFQEYLVASELLDVNVWDNRQVGKYKLCFTDDILSFVRESGSSDVFIDKILLMLSDFNGKLPFTLIRFIHESIKIDESSLFGSSSMWINDKGYKTNGWMMLQIGMKLSKIKSKFNWATISSLDHLTADNNVLGHIYGLLISKTINHDLEHHNTLYIISILHVLCKREIEMAANHFNSSNSRYASIIVKSDQKYSALKILLSSSELKFNNNRELSGIEFDLSRLISGLEEALSPSIEVGDINEHIKNVDRKYLTSVKEISNHICFDRESESTHVIQKFRRFWQSRPSLSLFVYQKNKRQV